MESCGCLYPQCDPQPAAVFTFTIDTITLAVSFTNQSANYNYFWWDFGDGNTSADTNTSHTYAVKGVYVVTLVAKNCSRRDTIIDTLYVGVTGVGELHVHKTLRVYPNPSNGAFTIEMPEPEKGKNVNEIKMLDVLGREVKRLSIKSQKTEVDISERPAGIYLIQAKGENSFYTARIVKH